MLSPSNEDYLKAIYELQYEQGQPLATTSALAQSLGVAPASVTEMLKRLASIEPPLVQHERYHGARLTPDGARAALQVVRAHRLLEQFLTEALGYRWDEVHEEAHRLEHAMSARLGERIAAYLGHPGSDPHGDPIPGPDGELAPRHDVALIELSAGEAGRVTRVHSHDAALLRYLGNLGIYPEVSIRVVEVAPFDGPFTLQIGERREAVGRAVVKRINVEPIATGAGKNMDRSAQRQ
jgi:DtxR family Mn-dependent transcriptional regulator